MAWYGMVRFRSDLKKKTDFKKETEASAGVADLHQSMLGPSPTSAQIVVPQACAERPDLSTGPVGGVEILALCEQRLAIAGVCAARLALLVGVDAMSISECHAMSWSMPWHGMACRSVSRHQRYACIL